MRFLQPSQLIVSLCVVGLLTTACTENTTPKTSAAKTPQPVITAQVKWQDKQEQIDAVGTSRALRSVVLYPRIDGIVESINFKTGQFVNAGESILKLESDEQALNVAQNEVVLKDEQRRLKRYKASMASGGVTQSLVDETQSAVSSAQIALNKAKVLLEYHDIKAPFTGHLGLTQLDPGAYVDTQTPIVSIDDRSQLLVMFELAETYYGQVKIGQQVNISPWQQADIKTVATVKDVDSRVNPQSRTFTVQAIVDNKADKYRPGMSFKVQLNLTGGRYPVVPETALQWGGDGPYIWRVENEVAKRTPVVIVQRISGEILVEAKLAQDSWVVKEGIQRMREGTQINDVTKQVSLRLNNHE